MTGMRKDSQYGRIRMKRLTGNKGKISLFVCVLDDEVTEAKHLMEELGYTVTVQELVRARFSRKETYCLTYLRNKTKKT